MMEITDSDAGTLYMLEDNQLHFRISRNKTLGTYTAGAEAAALPPVQLNRENIENISAYTAIKNEIVIVEDVYTDERFNFNGPKKYDAMSGYRTRSMLTLPLTASMDEHEEVLGVVQLLNSTDSVTGQPIPYGDINNPPIVPALTNVAANTLANLMYRKEIRLLFHSFVAVMTQAIDERSPYNNNHTYNVSHLCEDFAVYLRKTFPDRNHPYHFDEKHQEQLAMAALLHDIGKIITPLQIMDKSDRLGERLDSIRYRFEIKKCQNELDFLNGGLSEQEYELEVDRTESALELVEATNKLGFIPTERLMPILAMAGLMYRNTQGSAVPILEQRDMDALTIQKGTLTASERAIMQEHVSLTGRLLDKIAFWKYYKEVPDWAKAHHEFLNGTGYPLGLKGDQLTIEMCIITIMDIFDALTASDRPYKKSMPLDKALGILQSMADEGQLHGELVGIFKESKVWENIGI
jgi:HD-GYP domain-containing protein (c-di-GMP phosphodiesterase class II)